jgi:hypothetical protein
MKAAYRGSLRRHIKTKPDAPRKGFFQRHSRLVSFAGATLVLVTYLVKDELRDRAKDAADAADSNLSAFLQREQLHDIQRSVEDGKNSERSHFEMLGRGMIAMSTTPLPSDLRDYSYANVKDYDVADTHIILSSYQEAVREAQYEVSILYSFSPAYSHSLDVNVKTIENDFRPLMNYVYVATQKKDKKGLSQDYEDISEMGDKIRQVTYDATQHMLDELISDKASSENTLAAYNHYAPIVYLIGWLAALGGQLLGIKGVEQYD